MPRQLIWLSYDLGVRGDYAGLYSWLDSNGAKECGESVATLIYTYQGSLPDTLLADLRSAVDFNNRTRIYLVFRDDSGNEKGRFLVGRRRASAWTGYAADGETADDEIAS